MKKYFAVFANKRMLRTLLLGFSSGLPLALTGETLQAWVSKAGVDLATIGFFALVGLPYAMKFLWAPFLDQIKIPVLGRRRGWMAITQVGLFFATVGMAFSDPVTGISLFAFMAFLVAFFSASQDIVIDAYRTEIIEDEKELGAGASTYITGYRLATIVSGGLAFILADQFSWTAVYILMATINLVGLVTILLSPEPKVAANKATNRRSESGAAAFIEFFQRRGAMDILIFIMVYKISTLMATALMTKFLISLDYNLTIIGVARKGPGFAATIFGVLLGGSLMAKFGLKRSLWVFGIVQSLVGVTFWFLARVAGAAADPNGIWLTIIICLDNVMMGLGTTALTGFMMNFCNKQFTGTQYALLTSVMAVTRVILIAPAGKLVEWLGWDTFFILTVPLAIPGLLLLSRFEQWQRTASETSTGISKFDWGLISLFVLSLIALSSEPIFKFAGLPEVGAQATITGAAGVVLVVLAGLVRPYIPGQTRGLKPA